MKTGSEFGMVWGFEIGKGGCECWIGFGVSRRRESFFFFFFFFRKGMLFIFWLAISIMDKDYLRKFRGKVQHSKLRKHFSNMFTRHLLTSTCLAKRLITLVH